MFVSTTMDEGTLNNNDYTGIKNLAVSFAAGVNTAPPITINIINDTVIEPNETFGLIAQLDETDAPGTFLRRATFTIGNDDRASTTFSFTPPSRAVSESIGTVNFTLTRSSSSAYERVIVRTMANEGFANNNDYTHVDQFVDFQEGETARPVTIAITNDAIDEPNETFGLVIYNENGSATLHRTTFTINNDD